VEESDIGIYKAKNQINREKAALDFKEAKNIAKLIILDP
jgi:hypothetical protein